MIPQVVLLLLLLLYFILCFQNTFEKYFILYLQDTLKSITIFSTSLGSTMVAQINRITFGN